MASATPTASAPRHSPSALEASSMRGLRLDAGGSQVTEAVSEAHDLSPRFPHGVKEGYKRTFSGPSPHGRRHLFCMGGSAQCQRALPKGTYRFIAIRLLRSQRPSNFCYCDMGLGSWRWASQLPLGEAYAPQARGVHGLHHHVAYPAVADVMIETLTTITSGRAPARAAPPLPTHLSSYGKTECQDVRCSG